MLVSTTLFLILAGVASLADNDCQALQNALQRAAQEHRLEQVLQHQQALTYQARCSAAQRRWAERIAAQLVAERAQQQLADGRPAMARETLALAPISTWQIQATHGDLAAAARDWTQAASHYNQAVELLDAVDSTPRLPPQDVIDTLYRRASEAEVLSGEIRSVSSRGEASGILAQRRRPELASRGPQVRAQPIPVQFEFDSAAFSPTGERSARALAAYLRRQGVATVTLIGHTDERGDPAYNQRLSERRAAALGDFLAKQGVRARIDTEGRGESEPLSVDDAGRYSQEERWALDRRVEFRVTP